MFFLEEVCTNVEVLKVVYFVWSLLKIVFFIVPMGAIVMISLDLAKNVIAANDGDMSKNLKMAIKRCISCVAIFLVPTIVSFTIGLLGDLGVDYAVCLENIKDGVPQGTGTGIDDDYGNNSSTNIGGSSGITPSDNNNTNNNNNSITKITLNKTIATIGEKKTVVSRGQQYSNNTVQLEVSSFTPSNAGNKQVVWRVVKGSQYVKVNSKGKVTAITGGTATVRATLKSNSKVYAECKVTVVHSLYENVEVTKSVTVTEKKTNKKIKLKKGTKAILHGTMKSSNSDAIIEIKDTNRIVTIGKNNLKFKSYYIENKYSKDVYESYINDRGFTSKTNYLIWVNVGTQRLMLFKKSNNRWVQVENFATSTGDVEGKYNSGGSTGVHFDLEVQDFNSEAANPGIGRAIHVRHEDTKKYFGNTMHVGTLPKNSDGGNNSVTRPSSHGCPHLSKANRDKLYNTYNQKSNNKLINSKVIYY